MAVHIPIKLLTDNDKLKIATDLHLEEKINPIFLKKNKWSRNNNTKAIDFYSNIINENGEECIALPYSYTSEHFKCKFPNARLKKLPIDPFYMKEDFELYDYQEEAIELAKEDIKENGTCFFNVCCSFGKTIVGGVLSQIRSQNDGLLTLVIYPRQPLGKSWYGTFSNLTTAKCIIFEKDVIVPEDTQVILCMNTQIANLPQNIINKVGHLVIDEAHMFCTLSNVDPILKLSPKYITCLTATYERDDGFEIMLDHIVGYNRIVKISKKPFFVINLNTNFTPENVGMTEYGVDFMDLTDKIYDINERTEFIYKLVTMNLQHKIMILTKRKLRAQKLYDDLKVLLEPCGLKVSKYFGKDKSYDDGDVLIGTVSKIGVGFDEKETCNNWNGIRINILITDCSIKKIEQPAGRVFRAKIPVIIDIVDNHYCLKNHWNLRRAWYASRNGIIYQTSDTFKWSDLYQDLHKYYLQALEKEKLSGNVSNRINGKKERESKNKDINYNDLDDSDDDEEDNKKKKYKKNVIETSKQNINIAKSLLQKYSKASKTK